MSFYGGVNGLNDMIGSNLENAAVVVNGISNSLLGKVREIQASLGVVAAPIASGDSVFISARLIVADFMNVKQGPIANRRLISIPTFVVGFILTQLNFGGILRFFAWTNLALPRLAWWTITAYMITERTAYWIQLVPAAFLTSVIISFLIIALKGLPLPVYVGDMAGSGGGACKGRCPGDGGKIEAEAFSQSRPILDSC